MSQRQVFVHPETQSSVFGHPHLEEMFSKPQKIFLTVFSGDDRGIQRTSTKDRAIDPKQIQMVENALRIGAFDGQLIKRDRYSRTVNVAGRRPFRVEWLNPGGWLFFTTVAALCERFAISRIRLSRLRTSSCNSACPEWSARLTQPSAE